MCSLFAGIGGICLGFKQAGFDIVWDNEYDSAACKTYIHNFGNSHLVESDIRTVYVKDIPDFNVLTAGFPCQPFSIAGRQKGFKDGIKKLTLRECLDFQGFPEEFYFPKTITIDDAYKQIGNSVCVPVIKRIAEQIKSSILRG